LDAETRAKCTLANQLLGDPEFNALLSEMEDDTIESFTSSQPKDVEVRENAYADMKAIGRLRAKLKSYSDNFKLDEHRNRRKTDAL